MLCNAFNCAAHLLQRVAPQRSLTAPGTPLSVGSPAPDLTPQRPTSEFPISAAETARQNHSDFLRHFPTAASVLDRVARRKDQLPCGM